MFPKLSLISKRLTISFSDKVGVLLISWMVRSVYLKEEVLQNYSVMMPLWESKTVISSML